MSSITAADLKFGGRLVAACDAIGAGHLNRAAGIMAEIVDELNQEATANGLLAEEASELPFMPTPQTPPPPVTATELTAKAQATPMDLQSCARNAHNYGPVDSNGWRTCLVCEMVNVSPPENNGPVDMGATR